jgi:hypothetical protein
MRFLASCFLLMVMLLGGSSGQVALAATDSADESAAAEAGTTFRLTREAVLNGVTLTKGAELQIVAVKQDQEGKVTRVDLQEIGGDKRVFKGIAREALSALTAAPSAGAPSGDRTSVFKVAAQIPILRDLTLGNVVFARGSVLQVDRVVKDKAGKVTKLDLRETSGQKRRVRDMPVEKLLLALSPEDIGWADAEVGRVIQLGAPLDFAGQAFARGAKLTVVRVETDPKTGAAIRVDLRELEGAKRELAGVPVATLKQNGAVGTAAGAPK